MKLISVRFCPKTTRFRIKPFLLNNYRAKGYFYSLYSFLGCRWLFKVPSVWVSICKDFERGADND